MIWGRFGKEKLTEETVNLDNAIEFLNDFLEHGEMNCCDPEDSVIITYCMRVLTLCKKLQLERDIEYLVLKEKAQKKPGVG